MSDAGGQTHEQGRFRSCSSIPTTILTLDLVAESFNRVAELPAATAKPFLDVPGRLVDYTFVVKLFVVGQVPCRLFQLALELVFLAFEFIAVHYVPPRSIECSTA